MPIKNLEGRLTEIGRLRLGQRLPVMDQRTGEQRVDRNGNPVWRPERGNTWRLTSDDPDLLKLVAAEYGGDVQPWDNAPDDDERYELFTQRSDLRVIIPAGHALSQWMEHWRRNLCVRRCDGQQMYRGVLPTDQPCECATETQDPESYPCKPTTRLSVMLLDVPAAGVWRCELHGWYGAAELLGVAQLLTVAGLDGRIVPATLLIQQRSLPARPGRPSRRIVLPVLRPDHGFLRQVALEGAGAARALEGGRRELAAPGKALVDEQTGELYGELDPDPGRDGGDPTPAGPAGPTPARMRAAQQEATRTRQRADVTRTIPTLEQIRALEYKSEIYKLVGNTLAGFRDLIKRAVREMHDREASDFQDDATVDDWKQVLEYALELHEQADHETSGVASQAAGPPAAEAAPDPYQDPPKDGGADAD
ncbi:MAG TPA: hypothetical protein VFA45_05510 [Actinomycetes bacterium]|jgi:hypothetical protein|nr:hypothetical protein [Actinomycetes bacterium]